MAPIPQSPGPRAFIAEQEQAEKERQQKADCEAKGGTWNEATKTCELPTPTPEPEPEPPEPLSELELRFQRGGAPSEEEVPSGVAATREQRETLQNAIDFQQSLQGRPSTALAIERKESLQKETQRKIGLAAGAGQIDFNTIMEAEAQGINWKEAFLAGSSSVPPAALGAATTFGAIGAAATLPAGGAGALPAAAIGAIGGAITGFYVGITNNIKAQKGDLLSGKTKELKSRKLAMMNYISAANANPAGAEDFLLAYQIEKSLIRRDYNTLNALASEAGTLFGGQDGTAQIITYDVYFESVEPSLDFRMQEAILKPDPTRAYLSLEDLS